MRAAVLILVLALAAAPGRSRADSESLSEPKGPPKPQPSEADLPPYPETAPARPAGDAFEHQEYFWFNDNDGKTQWEDPALVITDEEGRESYIDPKTGKPTDTKPVEAAWLSLWSEVHETEYFYNEITKEATWDVPHLFAWHKVYVDDKGSVVAPPPEEEAEDFEGEEEDWSEEQLQAAEDAAAGWAPAEYAYDDAHEGYDHEGHDHEVEHGHHELSEEELAEEEVLRQEAAAGGEAATEEL